MFFTTVVIFIIVIAFVFFIVSFGTAVSTISHASVVPINIVNVVNGTGTSTGTSDDVNNTPFLTNDVNTENRIISGRCIAPAF
jgi:hypothetical protein